MFKATTPTHTFTLPFSVNYIDELLLTYKQDNVQLDFKKNDMTLENQSASVTLTQAQTNRFCGGKDVLVQMKIKTTSDSVLASNIIKLKVKNVLNNTEFEI